MNFAWKSALATGAATGIPAGVCHYALGSEYIFLGAAAGVVWLPEFVPVIKFVADRFLSWDYQETPEIVKITANFCDCLSNCLTDPTLLLAAETSSAFLPAFASLLSTLDTSPSPNHWKVIVLALEKHLRKRRVVPALLTTLIVGTGTAVGSLAGPFGTFSGTFIGAWCAYKIALRGDPVTMAYKLLKQLTDEERRQFAVALRLIADRIRSGPEHGA